AASTQTISPAPNARLSRGWARAKPKTSNSQPASGLSQVQRGRWLRSMSRSNVGQAARSGAPLDGSGAYWRSGFRKSIEDNCYGSLRMASLSEAAETEESCRIRGACLKAKRTLLRKPGSRSLQVRIRPEVINVIGILYLARDRTENRSPLFLITRLQPWTPEKSSEC